MSQISCPMTSSGGSGILTITPDTGGAVSGSNINLLGDGVAVTTTGTPGTSTIVISQSAASQTVRGSRTIVTSAQIKDLVANPVELIPAQGANTLINPINITGYLSYGGTSSFVDASGQGINIKINGMNVVNFDNFMMTSTNDLIEGYTAVSGGVWNGIDPSTYFNQPMTLINGSGTDISGNAADDNTITIDIIYQVLTY